VTWDQALGFAMGPGAAIIAGVLISIGVEYSARFQALGSKWKVAVFTGLCVAVPLAAQALSIATGVGGAWGDLPTTWWPAAWSGLSAAGVGGLWHAWKPARLRVQ
jgi:hypothetical protein